MSVGLPAATESAIANGDTRTLNLYNQHTNESISATYLVDGRYDPVVLEKLNWFLRDWRRNEATHMDPRLFDAVWETYREAGATEPVHVVCGYRSPQTNAMLRHRSHAVAQHSQHMLGKAMDTTMPGMSMEKVREIAMRLELGGVGFYGETRFVHIDVGGVRYWPRMTYAQLQRVFPDGKTVLIPTNGQPLPGYEEARAQIAAAGREVAPPPTPHGNNGNLFAWFFGGDKSADEAEEGSAQQTAANQAPAAQEEGQYNQAAVAQANAAANPQTAEKSQDQKSKNDADVAPAAKEQVAEQVPVPPHRPTDFLALASVPMPPGRSAPFITGSIAKHNAAASGADPIGALVKTSAGGRLAALPAIITNGASDMSAAQNANDGHPDQQALAYAPVAQMGGLRSAAHTVLPQSAAGVRTANAEQNLMLSPTLTGLRRASHLETAVLSHALSAGYLARFASVATNLPTDHFVGPAVVGLRAADRSRMIFVDGSAALNGRE